MTVPSGSPPFTRAGWQQPEEDVPEDSNWSAVKALIVAAGVSVLVLGITVALLVWLANETKGGPETALSLVFVAAAVVLILVICTLTIVLKRLRLVDGNEAMGLPRGSIRAVISLMLILLFFIAAVFLFNTTRRVPPDVGERRELSGIDEARFASIPTELLYKSTTTVADDGTTTYNVVLLPDPLENQASDDLAKQLITLLGTLVTAVAAFYFGANSVTSALKGQAERVGMLRGDSPGPAPETQRGRRAPPGGSRPRSPGLG
jgi:heme/copper-type cytochrome/quinol oxidase subunit 2